MHHSSDFLVVCDESGTVTYASPSVDAVHRRRSGRRILGDRLVDLLHPDDLEAARRRVRGDDVGWFAASSRCGCAATTVRGAGWRSPRPTSAAIPNVGGVVINSRDVTEAREAEAALRESEERFRALVQHGSDMVSVINADGTVRYASPAGARVLGLPDGLRSRHRRPRAGAPRRSRPGHAGLRRGALTRPGSPDPSSSVSARADDELPDDRGGREQPHRRSRGARRHRHRARRDRPHARPRSRCAGARSASARSSRTSPT